MPESVFVVVFGAGNESDLVVVLVCEDCIASARGVLGCRVSDLEVLRTGTAVASATGCCGSFNGGSGGTAESLLWSWLSFDWKDLVTFFHPELQPDFVFLEELDFVNSST